MKDDGNLTIWGVLLVLVLLAASCGGGGGDDDDDGGTPAGNGLARATAAQHSVRLSIPNEPSQTIRFSDSSFTQFRSSDGTVLASGTYEYEPSGNDATVRLRDSNSGDVTTFLLTFRSSTSGDFSFASTNGQSGSGSFVDFQPIGQTGPDPGTQQPGTGSGTEQLGPASLDGRSFTLTRSTGQTHFYSFTGNRFTDEDGSEVGAGTYSYSLSGSRAHLVLNYTETVSGPVELADDRHEIEMTFESESRGTYTSTYFFHEGGQVPQDGAFEFVQ